MKNNIKEYEKNLWQYVHHTTLNPYEPGAVRIHLVPSKYSHFKKNSSVAILNGRDIVPLNTSWSVLMMIFIDEVNKYAGKEINDKEIKEIIDTTVKKVKEIYRDAKEDDVRKDIIDIINVFTSIATGKETDADIGTISIGEYEPYMTAPHRMDLMISSMHKDGHWNCNQKCLHCYAGEQEYAIKNELSTEEWKKVIDKLKEIRVPQITFTGGEPTIRDDLVELIEYSKWFVTRLNTNGVLLTKELCKKLYDASLDSVQITLYSSNEEEHNKLVGANNFKETVEGIKNAIEAGINVSTNTPLCKLNKNYVDTLKFVKELGVKYVTCSGLIVTGNATKEESISTQLTNEELYNILKEATQYTHNNLMEIDFTSPGWIESSKIRELNLNAPTCGACLSNMAIAPDGTVIPCQSWLKEDAKLGNFLNDNWKNIWNSDKCKKIRKFSSKMEEKCPLRMGKFEK